MVAIGLADSTALMGFLHLKKPPSPNGKPILSRGAARARAVKGAAFLWIGAIQKKGPGPDGLGPRINHLDTSALEFHAVESGDNRIECSHVPIAIIGS